MSEKEEAKKNIIKKYGKYGITENDINLIYEKHNGNWSKIYPEISDITKAEREKELKDLGLTKPNPLTSFIICAVVFGLIIAFGSSKTDDDKKSDDYYYACTAAENEVKEKLKLPSSAKFGLCSEMDISNNGDVWTIKGQVEASNSFGAIVKNNFTVKIEITGENTYNRISVNVY